MTPFSIGAAVRVLSIGRSGVVVEAGRNGRYRVRVGGVTLACREDDLQPEQSTGRRHKKPGHAASAKPNERPRIGDAQALGTIDLHGYTVEEALQALEQRLDQALLAGLDHLDVIHGRSSGRIKSAVHRFLKDVSAVRHFALVPDNPGVTRVHF